jgi:hypothetical protein
VQATEARELLAAAQAAGLGIEVVPFNTPAADAAIAAHGPGAVRLPVVIVGGRYCLQRPTFSAVLECLKVLRGTRCTLPAGCVVLGASG